MMDFFEALRKRTIDGFYHRFVSPDAFTTRDGIYATIKALKEMMVGEPIPMTLEHEDMGPKTSTFLVDMDDELHARWDGYKGIDGEEVVVIVVRLS